MSKTIKKGVWYRFPDHRPPPDTVVLTRALHDSKFYFVAARYVENDAGKGEFVHPDYPKNRPKIYPSDFMLLDFYASAEGG